MTTAPQPNSEPQPTVTIDRGGVVRIRAAALFGAARQSERELFLRRVFSIPAVDSAAIDTRGETATVRLSSASGYDARSLMEALKGRFPPLPADALPSGRHGDRVTIHRLGDMLTTWQVRVRGEGRLQLRRDTLRNDRVVARRVEKVLAGFPGVQDVGFESWTSSLWVSFRPDLTDLRALLRVAEAAIEPPPTAHAPMPLPETVRFETADTTLGVAALTDFAFPFLMPVSTLMLVGTNLGTLRDASAQIRRRELGLPVLHSTILLGTLASGQFLASAAMAWMFRYWRRRQRNEIAAERQVMLEDFAGIPALTRRTSDAGEETYVPLENVRRGDRLVIRGGEVIPADGRVVRGEGVVDERGVRGLDGVSRKREGNFVLAGSTVLYGQLVVEANELGDKTRLAALTRVFLGATGKGIAPTELPISERPQLALRVIGPTLATAGVGLMFGGVGTALAVLRPDYATGPLVCDSLEDLGDIGRSLRKGIVVRDPGALDRLNRIDLMILADSPNGRHPALRLAGVESPRLEPDELLRLGGSLGRYLPGERGKALVAACRSRDLALSDVAPFEWKRGVTAVAGRRRLRLLEMEEHPEQGALAILIDERRAGRFHFRPERESASVAVFEQLRGLGRFEVAFASDEPGEYTLPLLQDSELATLCRNLRGRRISVAVVGDASRHARALAAADVGIAFVGDGDIEAGSAPILITEPDPSRLLDLLEVAASRPDRAREARTITLLPNLACVAGAFFLGFTSLTAVVLSNLGTFGNVSRARRNLRRFDRSRRPPRALTGGATDGLHRSR